MENRDRVLLIEDDLDLAEIIINYFFEKNISVTHVEDAAHAQTLLNGKIFGAVVTDLNLPGLSGLELLSQMKAKGQTTPVILITVSTDVEVAESAIEAGAYDFVVKPIHFPQLYISVQRALRVSKLAYENEVLKQAFEISTRADGIIGRSPAFVKAMELSKRAANSVATILIGGESGSGKEVLARAIHNWSPRREKPFLALNCSAIPEHLLEAELFGHAKGAFTGAIEARAGFFEEAEGGTVFLDEIGDMSLPLQAKLLRVIQERKIKRIGENQMRDIDVRVITATHKDLRQEIQAGRFREDLYFRLNVISVRIPPLRERREDIYLLADFFLKKFNATNGRQIKGFSSEAKEFLLRNEWRGNVRELENTIEKAVVLCDGDFIDLSSLSDFEMNVASGMKVSSTISGQAERDFGWLSGDDRVLTLAELQQKYIRYVFEKNGGAKEATARSLGIDRKTLYNRLREMERN